MSLLLAIALYVRFPLPRQVELPRCVPVCLSDNEGRRCRPGMHWWQYQRALWKHRCVRCGKESGG